MFFILLQYWKACLSIFVTLFVINTKAKLEQTRKVPFLIVVIPFGIVRDVIDSHNSKAYAPIEETL